MGGGGRRRGFSQEAAFPGSHSDLPGGVHSLQARHRTHAPCVIPAMTLPVEGQERRPTRKGGSVKVAPSQARTHRARLQPKPRANPARASPHTSCPQGKPLPRLRLTAAQHTGAGDPPWRCRVIGPRPSHWPRSPRPAGAPCSGRALSLLLKFPSLPLRTSSGRGQVWRSVTTCRPGARPSRVGTRGLAPNLPADSGAFVCGGGRALWQGPSLLAGAFLLPWSPPICGFLSRLSW